MAFILMGQVNLQEQGHDCQFRQTYLFFSPSLLQFFMPLLEFLNNLYRGGYNLLWLLRR